MFIISQERTKLNKIKSSYGNVFDIILFVLPPYSSGQALLISHFGRQQKQLTVDEAQEI